MTNKWYHFSGKEIPSLYDLEQDNKREFFKSRGLWLSYNNEWLHWQDSNNYDQFDPLDDSDPYHDFKYEADVNGLNLIRITTLQELTDFINKYSIEIYFESKYMGLNQIDWETVSKIYDGIMILNYHEVKNRMIFGPLWKSSGWFLGLDINSCCIWNASKIKSFVCIRSPLEKDDNCSTLEKKEHKTLNMHELDKIIKEA